MTKWELKCADSYKEAEKLADDGWELVAVNQHSVDSSGWVKFYFKREKKK